MSSRGIGYPNQGGFDHYGNQSQNYAPYTPYNTNSNSNFGQVPPDSYSCQHTNKQILTVKSGKNAGRPFERCTECTKFLKWVNAQAQAQPPQPQFSNPIPIPAPPNPDPIPSTNFFLENQMAKEREFPKLEHLVRNLQISIGELNESLQTYSQLLLKCFNANTNSASSSKTSFVKSRRRNAPAPVQAPLPVSSDGSEEDDMDGVEETQLGGGANSGPNKSSKSG